jgi:ABC-type polysaccharide/polyol phosphate export permease
MNWKLFGTIFGAVLLALIVFCSGLIWWNDFQSAKNRASNATNENSSK